ncbi:MAG TPA: hypothetical protein VHB47_18285, partial [Thermoanaerobaculia bacterium]|nr:hypothetical protein [Thermoanaerobaculia bacterium]
FLLNLAGLLFGARGSVAPALLVLGAAVAVAAVAAPRVCAGLGGWLRHLPVTGATHRRAAAAAIAVAEAPLLAFLALLVLAARSRPGAATAARLLGLLAVALAAAQVAVPTRRRAAAVPPALAAGLLAGLGSWPALAASVPLLAVADLAAGPPRSPRSPRPAHSRGAARRWLAARPPPAAERLPAPHRLQVPPAAAAPSGRHAPVLLPARIARRALGWRPVRAYAVALLPWLAALLFAANNRLVPLHATRAAVLGGGGSCVLLLAGLAGTLAARRPAWPWVRSLPWPARRRVLDDALLLGASCLPLLALTGLAAPAAVPPLAAILPWLAVRAAGAIRRPASPASPAAGRIRPSGEILMEGALLAGLAALLPWSALLPLAAVPVAVRAAAARERRLKVGAWMERHHLAAGDPGSWSGG